MNQKLNKIIEENLIPEPRQVDAQEIARLFKIKVEQIDQLFDQRAFPSEKPEGKTDRVADLLQVYKYFESSKAGLLQSKLRELPLDVLTDFHELSRVDAVNAALVTRYADEMAYGEKLPPVVVFEQDNGKFIVVDGRHRIEAAKQLGRKSLLCKIRRGTPDHQAICAIAANNANGRGKSSNEKAVGVKNILERYKELGLPQPPTRRIGKLVGISHVAVQKILNKLEGKKKAAPSKSAKPRTSNPKVCPIGKLGITDFDLNSFTGLRLAISGLIEKLDKEPALVASALRIVASRIEELKKAAAGEEKP